jgi:hypothetical protein
MCWAIFFRIGVWGIRRDAISDSTDLAGWRLLKKFCTSS